MPCATSLPVRAGSKRRLTATYGSEQPWWTPLDSGRTGAVSASPRPAPTNRLALHLQFDNLKPSTCPCAANRAARSGPCPSVPTCDVPVSCRMRPVQVILPSNSLFSKFPRQRSVSPSRDGLGACPTVCSWQVPSPRDMSGDSGGTGETRGVVEFDVDGLGIPGTHRCPVAPVDAQGTQWGTRRVGSILDSARTVLMVQPRLPASRTSGRCVRSISMVRWPDPQRRDPRAPPSPTRGVMQGVLGVDLTEPHKELRYRGTGLKPQRTGSLRRRLPKRRTMRELMVVAPTVQSHKNDDKWTVAEARRHRKPSLGGILAVQLTLRCVSATEGLVSTVAPSGSRADVADDMHDGRSRLLRCILPVASGSGSEMPSEADLLPAIHVRSHPQAWIPRHPSARRVVPVLLLPRPPIHIRRCSTPTAPLTKLSETHDGGTPMEVSCA